MRNGAILAPQEWIFYYVDARMTPVVPKKTTLTKPGPLFQELSELLLSGLEFIGAAAGWIGLQDAGGWNFPVRIGAFSDSWLPWQQGHGTLWGFTINDETAVLNDLDVGPKNGDPPLRNLLSSPLIQNKQIVGHIALANKTQSFAAEDAVVLRGLAHHSVRLLGRGRTPINISAAWRRILDHAAEGILLLEESGVLIYANAAWLAWTGFCAEELLGQTAPFPFWVSQHELVQALSRTPAAFAGALPFRRRDQSLFWCEVELDKQPYDDQLLTIAFLRQTPAPQHGEPAALAAGYGVQHPHPAANAASSPSLDWLPLLLDLDHGIEGWEARWQERTGLSVCDVKDSRCELVLDWLFPQQQDRNCVADCFHQSSPKGCQLILEVVAPNGSRPMLCTLIPLPTATATAVPRRWLLLAGEVESYSRFSRAPLASARLRLAAKRSLLSSAFVHRHSGEVIGAKGRCG
jgi:PAS domain S-box-containing protein